MRRVHARRGKKAPRKRRRYTGARKKRRKRERRSERQVHHGDTPSIILRREREREGKEMAVAGERKREKDLSHECCVWSSFMVARLNSRSEEGEFRKWRRRWGSADPGMLSMATFAVRRYEISRDRGRVAKTTLLARSRNISSAEGNSVSYRKLRASRALVRRMRANNTSLLQTSK